MAVGGGVVGRPTVCGRIDAPVLHCCAISPAANLSSMDTCTRLAMTSTEPNAHREISKKNGICTSRSGKYVND